MEFLTHFSGVYGASHCQTGTDPIWHFLFSVCFSQSANIFWTADLAYAEENRPKTQIVSSTSSAELA